MVETPDSSLDSINFAVQRRNYRAVLFGYEFSDGILGALPQVLIRSFLSAEDVQSR
jgi:hypothetical protein